MRARGQSWLGTYPIAHRGLHGAETPENSIPAFEAAVRAGYGIELDVHTTADGHLVVLHDADLVRMTGVDGFVADLRLAELGELRLLGTEFGIPTLDDVLRTVAGRVPVLVEVKPNAPMHTTGPALADTVRYYAGPLAIQSFDPRVLLWLKKHLPRVARGQVSGGFGSVPLTSAQKLLLRSMALNAVTTPHFVAYEVEAVPSWFVSVWQRLLRAPLLVWTVRTPEQLQRATRCRANVIFENVRPVI